MNIFLVGQVSSGKSSFVNALCNGIVSSTSIQRETFCPQYFSLSNDSDKTKNSFETIIETTKNLEKKHKVNQKLRKDMKIEEGRIDHINIDNPFKNYVTSQGDLNIYDFPGINDAEDKNDIFINMIKNRIDICDLMIFITDAKSAFVSKSELEEFNKLKDLVEKQNNNGNLTRLIVCVNKFDDPNSDDLNDIFNRIPYEKKYKISSHKILFDSIKKNSLSLYVPKFLKNEIQEIIKNSSIILNKKIIKQIKKNKIITHSDIEYQYKTDLFDSDSDSDSEENTNQEENCKIKGDWDDLYSKIEKNLKTLKKDTYQKKLDYYKKHILNNNNYLYPYGQCINQSKINNLIKGMFNLELFTNHELIKFIIEIFKTKNERYIILLNTLIYRCKFIRKIKKKFFNKHFIVKTSLHSVIIFCILCGYLNNYEINLDIDIYWSLSTWHLKYINNKGRTEILREKNSSIINDDRQFIKHLRIQTYDISTNYLLNLISIPIYQVSYLDKLGKIDYKTIEKKYPQCREKLLYWIEYIDNKNEHIGKEFFTYDYNKLEYLKKIFNF